jgi:uncharacterized sulfatase
MIRSLISLLLAGSALVASAADRPNIVMIISDDQAWTDYSFMGHKQIATPNIDRLAKESLTFTRGYVPSSLCCPSLASIVTGLYPHQHKITSNDPPIPTGMKPREFQQSDAFKQGRDKMIQFVESVPTLPRLLMQNGYNTLQTGKWWLGDFKHGGFTHGMTKGGRHGDQGLDIGRKTMQPIYDFIAESRKAEKPFFVWYAPMMPHDPHTPPAALFEKYSKLTDSPHIARYWAMCEWFDQTIGDLLKHLDEQGLTQNTIITYVSDNGWIQKPDAPRYAEKSKQSQYDGGLRSPIMVRWTGKLAPKSSETPVSSLDFFPTVLKLAGISAPATPGIDLTDEAAVAARKVLFGECFTHNFVNMDQPASSLRWRWMLQGNMKAIVPGAAEKDASPELYDVIADPSEEKSLASEKPDVVNSMTATLNAWWKP